MKRTVKNRPLVIFPIGEPGWASHAYILPELRKEWLKLGFEIFEYDHRSKSPPLELILKMNAASVLIFPIGIIHVDALSLLKKVRTTYKIVTPARLMLTCGMTIGVEYLWHYRDILRTDDRLIMNCRAEANLLRAWLPSLKLAIDVIPLPVDENLFRPVSDSQRNRLRREVGFRKNEFIVLFSGRLSAQKNVLSLLAVFQEFRRRHVRARLVLVGAFDEIGTPHVHHQNTKSFATEFAQAICALRLEGVVDHRDHLSQLELTKVLKACDVHISLTLHSSEDFGYGIAQGLACGTPTIVSLWGGGCDLGEVAAGIRVHVTENGPRMDYRQTLEVLEKIEQRANTEQRRIVLNQKFKKKFGVGEISRSWKKSVRLVGSIWSRSGAERWPLGRRRLKTKYPFQRTDGAFLKFLKVYSDASAIGAKSKSRDSRETLYLHPFFDSSRGEIADPLVPQRRLKLKQDERHALKRMTEKRELFFGIQRSDLKIFDLKRLRELFELGLFLK